MIMVRESHKCLLGTLLHPNLYCGQQIEIKSTNKSVNLYAVFLSRSWEQGLKLGRSLLKTRTQELSIQWFLRITSERELAQSTSIATYRMGKFIFLRMQDKQVLINLNNERARLLVRTVNSPVKVLTELREYQKPVRMIPAGFYCIIKIWRYLHGH